MHLEVIDRIQNDFEFEAMRRQVLDDFVEIVAQDIDVFAMA